ncbi:MAG: ATP-binding protein, partial [Fibrobacteres bacterium]|nr:ATP-binding protein [Fibrobacterota bacterium]
PHFFLAFNNLVSNAVNYTPNHGMIEIQAVAENGKIRINVYNTSIQIPENERATLFTPFARTSFSKSKSTGTGLGLYIVRKIAEAHGGYAEHSATPTGNVFSIVI